MISRVAFVFFFKVDFKFMNPNKIKKGLEKYKLKVLTNENDFLVKNLKKAG